MTMRLLMVSPALPTASGKGYQVRLYHQILGLAAKQHEVTLVAFAGGDQPAHELSAACRRITAVPWSLPAAAARAAVEAARLPLSVALYASGRMREAISEELRTTRPDIAHLVLVRMAPYLGGMAGPGTVLDLLDAAELNMRERARAAAPGARQLLQIEAGRLGAYEKRAVAASDLALVISRRDFEFLGSPPNARVLPNGVEPQAVMEGAKRDGSTIIFSGTMSYFPNADAAAWFARDVLPLVRRSVPGARFHIVGRDPGTRLKRLAELPGISLTGSVPEMSTEIAGAAVSVCPMRYGSGMQTKILEAMAVATPVVATSKALEGIPEDLHRYIHRADSPAGLAAELTRVLGEPEDARRLARQGLDAIARDHTWSGHVAELERLYEETLIPR